MTRFFILCQQSSIFIFYSCASYRKFSIENSKYLSIDFDVVWSTYLFFCDWVKKKKVIFLVNYTIKIQWLFRKHQNTGHVNLELRKVRTTYFDLRMIIQFFKYSYNLEFQKNKTQLMIITKTKLLKKDNKTLI